MSFCGSRDLGMKPEILQLDSKPLTRTFKRLYPGLEEAIEKCKQIQGLDGVFYFFPILWG